jgi:hypothetical protein
MERYEIRVTGHIGQRRANALECESVRLLPDGHSLLVFTAVDQSALYGLLGRLRDAGLELVSVDRAPGPCPETPDRPGGRQPREGDAGHV